jgi:peptidoglycan/LPS O-acetylase OafA/YrhL
MALKFSLRRVRCSCGLNSWRRVTLNCCTAAIAECRHPDGELPRACADIIRFRMTAPAPNAIVGHKLQALDGLRAIAIILVFLHHMRGHIPVVDQFTLCLSRCVGQGWIGVDLFFVLSGFLITGILLDTRGANNYFSGFYARRILRIFPLYYVVLTSMIIVGRLVNSARLMAILPLPQDRWLYYCYLTNWLGLWKAHYGPNCLAHFWSLAVEEQFYLIWPLIVWLVRPRMIPWVAGGLAAVAAVVRVIWVAHSGAQQAILMATVCRLDELFAGALCAFLFRNPEHMLKVRKWLPGIASLALGSFFGILSGMLFFQHRLLAWLSGPSPAGHTLDGAVLLFVECGGFVLLALGFGAIVLLAAHTDGKETWMQKFLTSRVLAPIGAYSYGIYVFHVPILGMASIFVFPGIARGIHSYEELFISEGTYILVVAAVTFVVSALSYEFFEKKILRFKRYFEAKYSPALKTTEWDDGATATETAA